MIKILGCIIYEHDLRLVAVSAVICILGCLTTTTLMSRACDIHSQSYRWLGLAAVVLGCTVWSLHFVAMLAFVPAHGMVYDLGLTMWSIIVASIGALAAFLLWRTTLPGSARVFTAGVLLGLAVTGMHYLGVAAMAASAIIVFDVTYVAASVLVSVTAFIVALVRAKALQRLSRRLEVAGWMALAVCGLHFTGMTAVTITPIAATDTGVGVLGSTTLAFAVGGVSVAILIASLAATVIEQHLSQRALQELGRMRLMSNLAREVLFIHREGTVLEVNNAGERMFKSTTSEIVGRSVRSLFTAESAAALARRDRCMPADLRQEEMEAQALDGTRVTVELSSQPIEYLGKPAVAVALRDLTNRKRDEARTLHLARHDALTNLPNRYTLLERLGIALDKAAQQRSVVAVVFIDLDRFKSVNDLHGHAAGDAVLIQASKRMASEIQAGDTLARIGGDEFVMVLASEFQVEKTSTIAARIIETLHRPFQIEDQWITIGASIGIAIYPDDGATSDTLMRAADAAMYRAKEEGRGALRFYEASMNAKLQARLQLKQEFAGAIDRDELVLHYQPIVNAVTGELETFEALVRWNNPRRGVIQPSEFIPLAEESGFINEIGYWVIQTACREAAGWTSSWSVAVNVSPKQFHHSDVCDVLGTALHVNKLHPSRLVVEVTEGILINDTAQAVATLNRLRDMGVRISLDDFGTGYSSLSYLQLFKFDKLKIDKSFVKNLGESEDAVTLTRTIINLAHNLGLAVTAEGVESPAQLAILRNMHCDQIQGYLVGRPAMVSAFAEFDQDRVIALFQGDRFRLSASSD